MSDINTKEKCEVCGGEEFDFDSNMYSIRCVKCMDKEAAVFAIFIFWLPLVFGSTMLLMELFGVIEMSAFDKEMVKLMTVFGLMAPIAMLAGFLLEVVYLWMHKK